MRGWTSRELFFPLLFAGLQLSIHIAFSGSYGYFRDELYYIACSEHLDWGYVDHPPLSIFILAIGRFLFGDSLLGVRILASLTGAVVVVLAALIARQLGGGRFAQGLASGSVVAAHALIGSGRYFSMNAFDVLFWTLALYVVIRVIKEEDPRLWLVFGVLIGLGLQNKYSVGFLVIGLVAGLLLTRQRGQLLSKWFWAGAAMAAVLFLPHVLWQISHGFPSLEFMRRASQEKNIHLSWLEFLVGQIRDVNVVNALIWIPGIVFFFRHDKGKRYRLFGWAYLVIFAIMVLGNAKIYYLSPIYPLLLAGGAVWFEPWTAAGWKYGLRFVHATLLSLMALFALPFAVPVLPVETFVRYSRFLGLTPRAEEHQELGSLPQYYADQFGWPEMVEKVAGVYHTLSPEEQGQCVIYARNYGEAGAIDFFGPRFGLPAAVSAHNSYWLWGPGERSGDVAIIFGFGGTLDEELEDLKGAYESVEPAGETSCTYCMPFENGRRIFICRGMRTTFQQIWDGERFYY